MESPQGVFALSPTIGPLGDGRFFRELERRMAAVWSDNPLAGLKVMQWLRNYDELTAAERAKAKRLFEAGLSPLTIAVTVKAYTGSILRAADDEDWSRPRKPTFMARIIALTVAEPTLTNAEITKRLGCTRSYVGSVRRKGGGP